MKATFEQEILQAHREGCAIEVSGRRKSRNWYSLFGNKCPVCGEVPQFEENLVESGDNSPAPKKQKGAK